MSVEIVSRERVHPTLSSPVGPTIKPLSILDAAALPFATACCIWLYDAPVSLGYRLRWEDSLKLAFASALDEYQSWSGQLHLLPSGSGKDLKYGRLALCHGSDEDPGAELVFARSDQKVEDIVPSSAEQMQRHMEHSEPLKSDPDGVEQLLHRQETRGDGMSGIWDASMFPAEKFMSTTPAALQDGKTYHGLPVLLAQVTIFDDGGFAVGMRVSHAVADATSLMGFMKSWARNTRDRLNGNLNVYPKRDHQQSATFIRDVLNKDKLKFQNGWRQLARSLPIHRFDRWEKPSNCPVPFRESMLVTQPREFDQKVTPLSSAAPVPWKEWDPSRPSRTTHISFSPAEVEQIWKAAVSGTNQMVSHLDALLAHVWICLSRARQAREEEKFFFNMVLGIRGRLSPKIPEDAVGSPTMHIHMSMCAGDLVRGGIRNVSQRIRQTIQRFNPETLPMLLAEMESEPGAQRLWQFFFGRRHVVSSSWLRLGATDIDFIGGARPRYVLPPLPSAMDGVIMLIDGPGVSTVSSIDDERVFYDPTRSGILVCMVMDEEVTHRLLNDPELRSYHK